MHASRTYADVNAIVGGYLRDLAFAQSSQQKMFGYKRAAAAILSLDVPLTELIGPDGTLARISGIGPGSTASSTRSSRPAGRRPSSGRSTAVVENVDNPLRRVSAGASMP